MRNGVFTYDSKVRLGKRYIRPWLKLMNFLAACADNSLPSRVAIELIDANGGSKQWFSNLKERFDSRYDLYGWNALGDDIFHQWVVPINQTSGLVAEFEKIDAPSHPMAGSLCLNVQIDFRLISPEGKRLNYQACEDYGGFVASGRSSEVLGSSRVDVYLSEHSSMKLFLTFPFERECQELSDYLQFLRSIAPFKFRQSGWRRWEKTKNCSYRKFKTAL